MNTTLSTVNGDKNRLHQLSYLGSMSKQPKVKASLDNRMHFDQESIEHLAVGTSEQTIGTESLLKLH